MLLTGVQGGSLGEVLSKARWVSEAVLFLVAQEIFQQCSDKCNNLARYISDWPVFVCDLVTRWGRLRLMGDTQ